MRFRLAAVTRTVRNPISIEPTTVSASTSLPLSDLLAGLGCPATPLRLDPPIRGLVDDSRIAGPGDLFLARSGDPEVDRRNTASAVEAGVAAVAGPEIAFEDLPSRGDSPVAAYRIADRASRDWVGEVAARFHRRPGERLAAIGVTGTNGKTTVTWLLRQLLHSAGMRCGLVGTVTVDDGTKPCPASLTTPGAIELQGTLARMVDAGCRAAAIEVSSHALDQGRVAGIPFTAGVFTNLSGDHLDYHGSMEAYAAAKRRLFEQLPAGSTAIVNAGDAASAGMIGAARGPRIRFAVSDVPTTSDTEIAAFVSGMSPHGVELRVRSPWGEGETRLPLVGRHNAENAIAAMAAAMVVLGDAAFDAVLEGLGSVTPPPGRFEPVPGGQCTVLVDYAHTDDALRRALTALRPLVPAGRRLVAVFGCGGDRDRGKRPRMAEAACEIADRVVVTSDNPRTEAPEAIIAEILTGVPSGTTARVTTCPDRAAAITEAIAEADEGDIVLIAGKGHEDYQIIGRERRAFDDRRVAAEAVATRWREAATNH